MGEEEYIKMRQSQAASLSQKFHEAHMKYPIKNNKIVFSTFEGAGGFCCNPRYIAEELYKRNKNFEMIWLVHDNTKAFPDYITPVKDDVENVVYHLSTAKVWIDNYRKPYGTLKREGQLYIQTWHGSMGIKAVGLYRGEMFPRIARLVSEWDSNLCDYVLSDSEYNDEIYPKKLLYNGPTLRTGFPRIDCLINEKEILHRNICEKYGIDIEMKLLLFAPTFRGGNQKEKKNVTSDIPRIEFDELVSTLERKFNCRWKILLRLHPQLAEKMDKMILGTQNDSLIDVSHEPDASQVLGGCDMVITDYSSIAFDAGYAKIPVVLYADDLDEYVLNRGKLMWKKEDLPFSFSETYEQLISDIQKFDMNDYQDAMKSFMDQHGVMEDGMAGQRVADFIIDKILR